MPVVDIAETRSCRCLEARRRSRLITRLYEERLRKYELRATQFSILAGLALKGPSPVGELADALDLERTTLTRSASLLERRGWIGSGKTGDARERLLHLTAQGRTKLESALGAWKEAQDEAANL